DIEAWLTEAYADPRVTALDDDDLEDRAARAWAYHRAFDAACVQMATNPSSASESDAGSASYSKDQRDTVCRKAAEFLAEFNELAPKVTTDRRTGGMTVEHEFTWGDPCSPRGPSRSWIARTRR